MPWFRFIEDAKVTIPFRNGEVEVTFANLGGPDGWAWVAQKKGDLSAQVVLVRTGNVMALRTALMVQGFSVPPGTPAEKIMRGAVKCGFAEDLPDDEHWRHELIQARAAARRRASQPESLRRARGTH